MQPCSREMQAIAASLSAIGIQPLLGGVGDEFLEQMLAVAPSAAWCDRMAEDPSPERAPAPAIHRYAPYDPIGGAAATPASSAAALGLFAPAIGDGSGEIDGSPSFKSLNPTGGEVVYDVGFGGLLPLPSTQRPSMSFGIAPTNVKATAITTTTPPPPKQRVRARRGQATDPHSIAERLRRERIAERMKALQELVPNANKTDKASMLDEIIDYLKFLQLQVKVLSVSRLGGASVAAPPVGDLSSEGGGSGGDKEEGAGATEQQVAKLMEEDMGTAMQYLQGKGLCLMPISLASAISSATSSAPSPSVAPEK